MTVEEEIQAESVVRSFTEDWNYFAYEVLGARLDKEQQDILTSVQFNPRTSVASGTARGKDYVTAVACFCFMFLTPKWNEEGDLIDNTKVALSAPTDRQVKNIMMPEISRLYNKAKRNGVILPGRLNVYDIRTEYEEWFLTGFKASEHNHEAWSGFHAVNTMFAITEASGISDDTFGAIEGNLQGNSRILIVFNPNNTVGYAARSQKQDRWSKFRLNSLTAPNVIEKRQVIPGQVDYEWITDKLKLWCEEIEADQVDIAQDDFEFEGQWYRPTDIFRIKVLGKFPKAGKDVLIPQQWIEAAQERWVRYHKTIRVDPYPKPLRLGVDVAGMGRDSTVFAHRHGNIGKAFTKSNSGGEADHMEVAGRIVHILKNDKKATAFIDTIGEGAGVYSRTKELGYESRALSCKNSEAATDNSGEPLTDITGQRTFANMRAYLGWAVRDWLNPKNYPDNTPDVYMPMLPPGGGFLEEATEIKYKWLSNGSIILEDKDDVIKRLKRSPDEFDAMANTFYPFEPTSKVKDLSGYF
ncbi:hypothetical protein GCM10028806_28370 [Spirosoma terrae]|uniref:Terminase n=1 Tax=Spirosoma terrae TaxID=1968276 RepID=A0A6L9LED0_9BACT|nr:hypothetical protein [Spirosoma terrae]NDU97203.1 hypothetical protein [Spirosoma terrae]